ncbi:MAG: adenylate cyclase [Patescibacteria group bacterium]|nr:adenylate cyclase [Patescibacteria group bacterium]MDD5715759.1 adenylate cyclase [Patescibacteria group bacterium]
MEVERKFVLSEVPGCIGGDPGILIRQGYLDGKSAPRLRQCGTKGPKRYRYEYFMTVKNGGQLSRREWETEIPRWVFCTDWPLTQGRRLEKYRYSIRVGNLTFEVDVFQGSLAGLFILEIEFESEQAANAFVPPADWPIIREVTYDKRYRNRQLAVHGLPAGDAEAPQG